MSDYTTLPLEGLLQEGGFDCPYCGKHHSTGLKHLRVGKGVIKELPDVLGKSATQASQTLLNAGLSVHIVGATNTGTAGAVVVEQSVTAGNEVPKGTCIKITMRHTDNTD